MLWPSLAPHASCVVRIKFSSHQVQLILYIQVKSSLRRQECRFPSSCVSPSSPYRCITVSACLLILFDSSWALTDQGSASVDRLNDDAYRSYGGSLTSSVNQTGFDQQIKPQCTEDVLVPQRKRQLKLYISLSKTKSKPVMKTLKLNIVCIHLATFIWLTSEEYNKAIVQRSRKEMRKKLWKYREKKCILLQFRKTTI